MKTKLSLILTMTFFITLFSIPVHANNFKLKVTFTNLTANVVLTPPVFATTKERAKIFELTEPASEPLEMLAEGGATDGLAAYFEDYNLIDVVQTDAPVLPGESITIEIKGRFRSHLSAASMLLPTNDGFVALNSRKIKRFDGHTFYLKAYDSGTEINDELCESIPGPQCGGEGYNPDGGEGFVYPHPGIHGESELMRHQYNWADPVAKITVSFSY